MVTNRKRHIIFSGICGVLAGLLALVYLAGGRSEPELGKVIVALQDIPKGQRITPGMIGVEYAGAKIAREGFSSDKAVVNRVAGSTIFAGEPILSARIGSSDKGSEIAHVIDDGNVAIAVSADLAASVGGAIRPGDRVDIFVTTVQDERGPGKTKLLFEDVKVLAMGGDGFDTEQDDGFIATKTAIGEGTIVIELTQDQANDATYYSETAKLKFALRSRGGER
ncbi:MAG: Flp pilus assembly protein CpaB [Candidatus Aquicultorales bacterium]